MLVVNTLLSISDHLPVYLVCLLLAGLLGVGLNYIFLRRYVSGLMSLQISFAFNTAIILFGWATGAVSMFRVVHFFLYQLTVVIGVYWVYRSILRNRGTLFPRLHQLNVATLSAVLVSFNLAMFGLFLCLVVHNDGGSRVEFMTASWFSFLRPAMSILTPLSFLLPFYLFDRGHRLLPLLILASSVISNVASGSKASFVFGILGSLLLYEDLKGCRLAISKALSLTLLGVLSLSAVVALERLDVTMADLADRFARFGESTIMAYYSADPSAAASGTSTLAKVHRGVARAFGDSSAADIDTLFGFALSREEYGAHNFTGPNAQVPSYMLCNYSGWGNVLGVTSILGYLIIVGWFLDAALYRQVTVSVVLLPFVVASLNTFPQDYYQGMSDVTVICIVVLAWVWMNVVALACKGVKKVHVAA